MINDTLIAKYQEIRENSVNEAILTRQHFVDAANFLRKEIKPKYPKAHELVGEFFIKFFKDINPKFDEEKFRKMAKLGKYKEEEEE